MTGQKLSIEENSSMGIEPFTFFIPASKFRSPNPIFRNIHYNKMIPSLQGKEERGLLI